MICNKFLFSYLFFFSPCGYILRTRNVAVEDVVEFKSTGTREVVGLTESEMHSVG